MPIEIAQHAGYYLARFSGTLGPEDLAEATRLAAEIEKQQPAPVDRIIDLTAVQTFNVTFLAVSDTAKVRREVRFGRVVKSALVADRPVAIGFARMYQTILNNPEIEVAIFATVAEALAWLAGAAPADPGGAG